MECEMAKLWDELGILRNLSSTKFSIVNSAVRREFFE